MSHLTQADLRARDEIRDLLASMALGDGTPSPALPRVLPRLRDLFRARDAMAYCFEARGAELAPSFVHNATGGEQFQRFVDALTSGPRKTWGGMLYDPARPAPEQRNRVRLHHWKDGSPAAVRSYLRRFPTTLAAFERFGLVIDQMRVLVCDGPALLSWVGAFRERPFEEREGRLLHSLIPSLRARLILERQLDRLPATFAGFVAALEAIGAPAFLVRSAGRVVHANAAGQARLGADPRTTLERLRADIAGRGPGDYAVSHLRAPGVPAYHLAVGRRPPADPRPPAEEFARRHGLTPRQAEVLPHVAVGMANKSIATVLGCAESTVELHVTGILARTGAETRAELVARFWTERR